MQAPWKERPKSLLDRLIDCLAMGAAIFKQAEGLKTLRSKALLVSALVILRHCQTLDATLQVIFEDLERDSAGPLYWPVLAENKMRPTISQMAKCSWLPFSSRISALRER
jgi:hypothetical protein